MKTMLLLLAILPATFCYAQEEKTTKPRPWKELPYKNSLSVDISPAIGFVAGKLPSHMDLAESVGATYRHFWKNKHVLRVGYRSIFSRYYYESSSPTSMGYLFIYPDSIKVYSRKATESFEENWHTVRVGYEKWFGSRRVKAILGIDFNNGFYRIRSSETVYEYESETYKLGFDTFSVHSLFDYADYNIIRSDSYSAKSYIMGITPMLGLNIHASKRISLTMHLYYDFYWNIIIKEDIVSVYDNRTYSGMQFISDPFFGDISLTYHFGQGKKAKKTD